MARRVFVDTSGWYALIDRRDAGHDTTRNTVEHLDRDGHFRVMGFQLLPDPG